MPTEPSLASVLQGLSECPPPVPCPRCSEPGYDVLLAVPEHPWEPGTVVSLEIRPGLRDAPPWGKCVLLNGSATEGEQTSEVASIATSEDCVPVPEPPVSVALPVVLAAVACCVGMRKAKTAFLGASSRRPALRC